jgi:hypothetical protein
LPGDRVVSVAKDDRNAQGDAGNIEIPVGELRRLAKANHVVGSKPSFTGRLSRTFIVFCFAASTGVGATLAWQSYSRETEKAFQNWAAMSLQWASSFLPASAPPHLDRPAEQTLSNSVQVSAQETALPKTTPIPQLAPSPISSELVQQLKTAARNLAALQSSVAELAAKQEEMSSNIAKLQAADREIRQKLVAARRKMPIAPQQLPSTASTSPAQSLPSEQSSAPKISSATSPDIRPTPVPRPPSVLRE